VIKDPPEVGSLSRRVMLQPISVSLQNGIRFLWHPLPAPPSVGLTTFLPLRERFGLTLFRLIDMLV